MVMLHGLTGERRRHSWVCPPPTLPFVLTSRRSVLQFSIVQRLGPVRYCPPARPPSRRGLFP